MPAVKAPDCLLLIPYYEAPEALLASLQSVTNTSDRIDVLVVDDGSVRHPAAPLLAGRTWPFSVQLETLPSNAGVERALNHGLRTHGRSYAYIARLDTGDLCLPDRFPLQLAELDANPDLLMLGGAIEFFSPDGRAHVEAPPTSWTAVRRRMRVNCAFYQPSVIFRATVLDLVGLYPEDRLAAEDYAYFWKIVEAGEARNLSDVVVRCVIDPNGISTVRRKRQIRSRMRVMLDHFSFTPLAVWGLLRSAILYPTPRALTVAVRRRLRRLPS